MKKILALALLSSSVYAGEYIVKLKDTKSFTNLKSFGKVRDMKVSIGNFYVLETENKSALSALSNDPNVEYVEPNITYTAFESQKPNDKLFKKQWGLQNTGKNSGWIFFPGKKGIDVNALKAWEITKGKKDIKIAIIDTGIDYSHKDLAQNIMINEAEKNGKDGVDDDGNGYIDDIYGYDFANNDNDPMDGHGHGTHCAGVIGASHNDIGIAGIMSKVQMLPIKFLADNGSGKLEWAVKSIDYAIRRGVDIMSNSWGGGGFSQALYDVIKVAQDKGILFIAAAGNSRNDNDKWPAYPASYELENIVSVGAIDGKGKKAGFSNYGEKTVHIFAPGVDILSTVANNKYKKMSGTSMACPHVSGVAGLLLANDSKLDFRELKERLMNTATSSEDLSSKAQSGMVDAYKALLNER